MPDESCNKDEADAITGLNEPDHPREKPMPCRNPRNFLRVNTGGN